jgi:very-short-patch-repair endonuclease
MARNSEDNMVLVNTFLDFYCASDKLAIELDGHHHYTDAGFKRDEARTEYLKKFGIRVLRFENDEVFKAEKIRSELINNPTQPSLTISVLYFLS